MVRCKTRKVKSKVVRLNPDIWVRSADDIKTVRKLKLRQQGGLCAITKAKLTLSTGVLDHAHDAASLSEDGRLRGVLASQVNMLEGRFLKLFKKARIQEKYDITFEDFLINMGNYLKQSNTQEKFHFKYMDDFRKVVKRWRKDELLQRLAEDFGIIASDKTLVVDLVQMYVQHWVYKIESLF
ncbi:endonuclease VII [Shewanella sp. phage 1/4]|uniref:endonuclease VII n=1 Tax=Shewanella phage 1/4 TaxID=1458859 RepID=UPI0004F9250C|nr:endonuclease VII [Shewanella sp. phage 1/4]AHK11157.1 endonuclease VII [Shewanella sp. phage 1/4]